MKNIVLCFDRTDVEPGLRDATNVRALFRLLDDTDGQIRWYDAGTATYGARARLPAVVREEVRETIAEAYEFLVDAWQPGDAIYIFGLGRGAYCARALTRLLGTVGVVDDRSDDVLDYAVDTYTLPRTMRSAQDWQQVRRLAAELVGQDEIAVPVRFLGLWDTVRAPGLPSLSSAEPLDNVVAGRHAVAIDGSSSGELLWASHIEQVWFRGAHCDVTGGPSACWPLADIALDWVLDGAVSAGIRLRDGFRCTAPAPSELYALASNSHVLSRRKLPLGAPVHASVEIYVRAHPQYWRRLPARFEWADLDWLARSERLAYAPTEPATRVERRTLTAAAS
ncbi:T6SS phospholipase effector Tle1-like catalytic domain-containing protein [Mycobacterium hubeiense]|uniref:phospholipase effector Tle1 domain-containing protein n=1 Tax=Mycobacterium hubeiense TaxID=1867256 RepID=UPI000C7EC8DF|nr:DUF2235 domain-containing protein [Mycobacterium sp. QGD 101]